MYPTAEYERVIIALLALLVGIAAVSACMVFVHFRGKKSNELNSKIEKTRSYLSAGEKNSKYDLISTLSHEIRTPLNGILGYSELLKETSLDPEQRRYIERLQFASSAMLSTIDDILDFAKIESGKLQLRPHRFAVVPLIDNVSSIISHQIQQKGLNLNVELGPELPKELVGDEVRIRQILLNLLNNAKKYTEEGGICISVDMVDRISGPCIRFTVRDTGIGIDECDIEFIFKRFYQVSQAGLSRFGGSGLGLAISKHLTESMGGEIGVESVKNKGSNFWFTIPCSIAKEEVRSVTNLVPIRTTKLGKILLVEDLEYNRDLAVELLTKYGHTIDVAENGAEAVSMVQNGAYDLVLMDIRMPVMDGLTATVHIRNLNHQVSNIPIIAMTANTLPDEVELFGKAGMNDYIAKPYHTEELMTKIGTYLNRSVESEQILQNVEVNLPSDDEPALTLFGEQKLNKMTQELIRRIDEFSEASPSQINRFELARKAHDVISLSGMLGYHTLSNAYLNLEEACKNDLDVPVAFNAALVASEPLITNAKTPLYHA